MERELKYDLEFIKLTYSKKMLTYYNIFKENRELFIENENILNIDNIIFQLKLHMNAIFGRTKEHKYYFDALDNLFGKIEKIQDNYPERFIWNFEFTFL